METNNWLEKLDKFLDTEEGRKSMTDWLNKMELEKQREIRWADRMHERIKGNIDESIEHLIKWYDSDKYRDREWKMGFEPRERLFWVLWDVAKKYGREATENEWDVWGNMFTGNIYIFGSYAIQIMHGQGSVIKIDKIS